MSRIRDWLASMAYVTDETEPAPVDEGDDADEQPGLQAASSNAAAAL